MSHPIFETMAAVDVVEDSYGVVYQDGNISLEMKYRDFNGETNTLCISGYAIRALAEKLHEAQTALLEKSIKPSKMIAFDLITGPTRGETYLPQGEPSND